MNNEIDKEKLEKLLHSIAQEAKPDKNFEQMLQHKLKMRFAAKYSTDNNDNEKSGSFWSGLLKFKLQVSSALVLVLFSSTTIYAYNSDGVTNGHILYPLKRSVEKVEEIFISSPEEKTGYYNRMAERRIRELDYLEAHGSFDEETVIEADALLSMAEIEAANISNENIRVGNTRTGNPDIENDTSENEENEEETSRIRSENLEPAESASSPDSTIKNRDEETGSTIIKPNLKIRSEQETSEIRSGNSEPVESTSSPDSTIKNRDEDSRSIIIKPNLEIRPEQEIITGAAATGEFSTKSSTRRESAVLEVKQTRDKLKARLETHLEKNPEAGSRLENLEQKFKVF